MSLHSLTHFQIYEPYLKAICDAWPTPTIFERNVHSIATLDSRIRVCAGVLARNPGFATTFDVDKWNAFYPQLKLSQSTVPGKLWCGPRGAAPAATPTKVTLAVADNMPEATLRKLLDFLSDGFCEPVTILSSLPVAQIAQSFDVQVQPKGMGVYVVS